MQEKQVNFLPRLKEKVSTPEGVPRLFDLITVRDERMKLAFFATLGNTVVAKDIDQVDYCTLCGILSSLSSLYEPSALQISKNIHYLRSVQEFPNMDSVMFPELVE